MDEIFNDLNSIEDITEVSDNALDTEDISNLEYKEIIGEEAPILDTRYAVFLEISSIPNDRLSLR